MFNDLHGPYHQYSEFVVFSFWNYRESMVLRTAFRDEMTKKKIHANF